MILDYLLFFIGAYLLGSIPFAQLLAKTKGVNLLKSGSGNPGSSNVLASTKSLPLTAAVLVLDSTKGMVFVLLAKALAMPDYIAIWCGAFAVLGHAYSIFIGFKGGRGVLTAMGAILAFHLWSGLTLLIIVFAVFTPFLKNQPLGVFICYMLIPFFPIIFQYQNQNFWLYLALFFIVFISLGRRLFFVKRRSISEQVPNGELFMNRLLFDRDIKDKKAWVAVSKSEDS